jgi:putative Holliday junction resolvase
MMRYIAVDLGDRRTGVAVGDSVTGLVTPLTVLEASLSARGGEELLGAIERVVVEQCGAPPLGELVVGLPVNMDGSEGPRARSARAFGRRLGDRLGRAVHFQDERLTSSEADWTLARSGYSRGEKKRRRDALAAASILRDFLARTRESGPDGQGSA